MTEALFLALTTTSNAIEDPLLRLPAELRNKIYEYILYEGTYRLRISNRTRPGHRHPEKVPVCLGQSMHALALLRICRQVHVEARLFPYCLNVFQFESLLAFQFCVGFENRKLRFTLEQRQAVRTIELKLYFSWKYFDDSNRPSQYFQRMEALGVCIRDMLPNLQAVTVIVDEGPGGPLDETLAKYYGKENWTQTEQWLRGGCSTAGSSITFDVRRAS